MTEDGASTIGRIINKFESSYNKDELRHIRQQIASHIDSTADSFHTGSTKEVDLVIPTYIQGCRRRYLLALRSNITARDRLAKLQNDNGAGSDTNSKTYSTRSLMTDTRENRPQNQSPASVLYTHLELLKLRRLRQQYDALITSAKTLEDLAARHDIYNIANHQHSDAHDIPQILRRADSLHIDIQSSNAEIADVKAQIRTLTSNLEIAVIKATKQLQHERDRLDKLPTPDPTSANNASKLHALTMTRTELTNWIESCLEACDGQSDTEPADTVVNEDGLANDEASERSTTVTTTDVEEVYDSYLSTRKRLLAALSHLSSTRLPTSIPSTTSSILPTVQPGLLPSLRSSSSASSQLFQLTSPTFLPLHNLTTSLLPSHQDILSTLISSSNATLLSTLTHLQHESQLLHSHFNSDLHQHIQSHSRGALDGTSEAGPNTEIAKALRLLEMWKTAGQEVEKQSREVVGANVVRGMKFVAETEDVIREIRGREDVWQRGLGLE